MARAPFLTAAKHYLDDVRPFYRESTLIRKSRDLRTIYRDLQKLGIQTTPAKLKEEHIKALLMKWQERLEPASQEKLVTVLDGFLIWIGNPVISVMRQKRHIRLPHSIQKPIRVLNTD